MPNQKFNNSQYEQNRNQEQINYSKWKNKKLTLQFQKNYLQSNIEQIQKIKQTNSKQSLNRKQLLTFAGSHASMKKQNSLKSQIKRQIQFPPYQFEQQNQIKQKSNKSNNKNNQSNNSQNLKKSTISNIDNRKNKFSELTSNNREEIQKNSIPRSKSTNKQHKLQIYKQKFPSKKDQFIFYSVVNKQSGSGMFNNDKLLLLNTLDRKLVYYSKLPEKLPFQNVFDYLNNYKEQPKQVIDFDKVKKFNFVPAKSSIGVILVTYVLSTSNQRKQWKMTVKNNKLMNDWIETVNQVFKKQHYQEVKEKIKYPPKSYKPTEFQDNKYQTSFTKNLKKQVLPILQKQKMANSNVKNSIKGSSAKPQNSRTISPSKNYDESKISIKVEDSMRISSLKEKQIEQKLPYYVQKSKFINTKNYIIDLGDARKQDVLIDPMKIVQMAFQKSKEQNKYSQDLMSISKDGNSVFASQLQKSEQKIIKQHQNRIKNTKFQQNTQNKSLKNSIINADNSINKKLSLSKISSDRSSQKSSFESPITTHRNIDIFIDRSYEQQKMNEKVQNYKKQQKNIFHKIKLKENQYQNHLINQKVKNSNKKYSNQKNRIQYNQPIQKSRSKSTKSKNKTKIQDQRANLKSPLSKLNIKAFNFPSININMKNQWLYLWLTANTPDSKIQIYNQFSKQAYSLIDHIFQYPQNYFMNSKIITNQNNIKTHIIFNVQNIQFKINLKLSLPYGLNQFISMIDFIKSQQFIINLNKYDKQLEDQFENYKFLLRQLASFRYKKQQIDKENNNQQNSTKEVYQLFNFPLCCLVKYQGITILCKINFENYLTVNNQIQQKQKQLLTFKKITNIQTYQYQIEHLQQICHLKLFNSSDQSFKKFDLYQINIYDRKGDGLIMLYLNNVKNILPEIKNPLTQKQENKLSIIPEYISKHINKGIIQPQLNRQNNDRQQIENHIRVHLIGNKIIKEFLGNHNSRQNYKSLNTYDNQQQIGFKSFHKINSSDQFKFGILNNYGINKQFLGQIYKSLSNYQQVQHFSHIQSLLLTEIVLSEYLKLCKLYLSKQFNTRLISSLNTFTFNQTQLQINLKHQEKLRQNNNKQISKDDPHLKTLKNLKNTIKVTVNKQSSIYNTVNQNKITKVQNNYNSLSMKYEQNLIQGRGQNNNYTSSSSIIQQMIHYIVYKNSKVWSVFLQILTKKYKIRIINSSNIIKQINELYNKINIKYFIFGILKEIGYHLKIPLFKLLNPQSNHNIQQQNNSFQQFNWQDLFNPSKQIQKNDKSSYQILISGYNLDCFYFPYRKLKSKLFIFYYQNNFQKTYLKETLTNFNSQQNQDEFQLYSQLSKIFQFQWQQFNQKQNIYLCNSQKFKLISYFSNSQNQFSLIKHLLSYFIKPILNNKEKIKGKGKLKQNCLNMIIYQGLLNQKENNNKNNLNNEYYQSQSNKQFSQNIIKNHFSYQSSSCLQNQINLIGIKWIIKQGMNFLAEKLISNMQKILEFNFKISSKSSNQIIFQSSSNIYLYIKLQLLDLFSIFYSQKLYNKQNLALKYSLKSLQLAIKSHTNLNTSLNNRNKIVFHNQLSAQKAYQAGFIHFTFQYFQKSLQLFQLVQKMIFVTIQQNNSSRLNNILSNYSNYQILVSRNISIQFLKLFKYKAQINLYLGSYTKSLNQCVKFFKILQSVNKLKNHNKKQISFLQLNQKIIQNQENFILNQLDLLQLQIFQIMFKTYQIVKNYTQLSKVTHLCCMRFIDDKLNVLNNWIKWGNNDININEIKNNQNIQNKKKKYLQILCGIQNYQKFQNDKKPKSNIEIFKRIVKMVWISIIHSYQIQQYQQIRPRATTNFNSVQKQSLNMNKQFPVKLRESFCLSKVLIKNNQNNQQTIFLKKSRKNISKQYLFQIISKQIQNYNKSIFEQFPIKQQIQLTFLTLLDYVLFYQQQNEKTTINNQRNLSLNYGSSKLSLFYNRLKSLIFNTNLTIDRQLNKFNFLIKLLINACGKQFILGIINQSNQVQRINQNQNLINQGPLLYYQ